MHPIFYYPKLVSALIMNLKAIRHDDGDNVRCSDAVLL